MSRNNGRLHCWDFVVSSSSSLPRRKRRFIHSKAPHFTVLSFSQNRKYRRQYLENCTKKTLPALKSSVCAKPQETSKNHSYCVLHCHERAIIYIIVINTLSSGGKRSGSSMHKYKHISQPKKPKQIRLIITAQNCVASATTVTPRMEVSGAVGGRANYCPGLGWDPMHDI